MTRWEINAGAFLLTIPVLWVGGLVASAIWLGVR